MFYSRNFASTKNCPRFIRIWWLHALNDRNSEYTSAKISICSIQIRESLWVTYTPMINCNITKKWYMWMFDNISESFLQLTIRRQFLDHTLLYYYILASPRASVETMKSLRSCNIPCTNYKVQLLWINYGRYLHWSDSCNISHDKCAETNIMTENKGHKSHKRILINRGVWHRWRMLAALFNLYLDHAVRECRDSNLLQTNILTLSSADDEVIKIASENCLEKQLHQLSKTVLTYKLKRY